MIKAVVLDVDDTLYLERDYVRSGFNAVEQWCRTQLGVERVGRKAWELFEAGVRRTTLSDALAAVGLPEVGEELTSCIEVYRSHVPTIALTADSAHFLDVTARHTLIGVVTDGPSNSQHAKCEALGLKERAHSLVITADHGSSKPDPSMYALVVQDWPVEPHEILWVADNPAKDFQSPEAMGWHSVRINRPGSLHHNVGAPSWITELQSLADLARVHEFLTARASQDT